MFCKYCGKEIDESVKFCKYCGENIVLPDGQLIKQKGFSKKIPLIILLFSFFVFGIFLIDKISNKQDFSVDQSKIISSVVNIYCESTISEEDSMGGSGTIITEDGLILTNSHIIPQEEDYLNIYEKGCIVVLPDPITGYPDEFFWAHPIVIPDISDYYDLAFMEIYDAYYDEEEKAFWGVYPREFPVYESPIKCRDENVQLGESIRIYGYPELVGGGYSLTITDGLVSNFLGGGLIATSAKISSGNSGGLAVDQNGCMIGVPSMIISDENERFGVIISSDMINEFIDSYNEMFE